MAEDLTAYLEEKGLKVQYLHSDIDTLKRLDVLSDLRSGNCDVVVGINLLREGLDLPEVSLVAILDADKEGFLRSKTALIQTMGRASRHLEGTVIMYADTVTRSMQAAIAEVNRRRQIQIDYNLKYHITPVSITKPIRDRIVEMAPENPIKIDMSDINQLIPEDLTTLLKMLRRQMLTAAKNLDFELAALLRDKITAISTYHPQPRQTP
jgi:excinuclease ABC subunit B